MARVPVDFLIGFLLGFVLAIGYYDGFVAQEYKEKIKMASDALRRADNVIIQKTREIEDLAYYIDVLILKYNSEKGKSEI